MHAAITAIEYHLPDQVLSNAQLAEEFPDLPADKIEAKTGIIERHVAADYECSSDLAVMAVRKLFARGVCQPHDIDYLLFCTQSPDYFLPTTACLLQDQLGLPKTCGALDFNLGSSGFVYGLSLAKGIIETGQAYNVLLITAETYSKFIHPADKSTRTLFGDAAAATLIQAIDIEADHSPWIGPFVFGTDGGGARNLIVPAGGMRYRRSLDSVKNVEDDYGNVHSDNHLYMNGAEIFSFTLRVVPQAVTDLLNKANKSMSDIDRFVLHQANQYMLDYLRRKMKIPEGKFCVTLRYCGNTVSSTIPIALKHAQVDGGLQRGQNLLLVGFGVGYSWAATLVRWFTA